MDKIKMLEDFLEEWERLETGENSYLSKKENEEENGIYFINELYDFLKNNNYEQASISYIGGFDSCGYTIESYALTFLQNGKIQVYPINIETY